MSVRPWNFNCASSCKVRVICCHMSVIIHSVLDLGEDLWPCASHLMSNCCFIDRPHKKNIEASNFLSENRCFKEKFLSITESSCVFFWMLRLCVNKPLFYNEWDSINKNILEKSLCSSTLEFCVLSQVFGFASQILGSIV